MVYLKIGDEHLELSWEQWEQRVASGRVPPTALVRFEPVTGEDWVPAGTLEMYESLRDDGAIAWRSQFLQAGPPIVTALLVGVNIRIWWLAWWSSGARTLMVEDLALYSGRVLEDGEIWRLLTMGFSHAAAFHLALNMLWLAYTGANIERALGRANLILLYVGSVTVGSLMSMFGSPENGSLGASGGVFGLVAASVVFGFVRPQLLPQRGRQLFGWALVPYLVLMFGSGLASPDTDNWAHFGGLVAGACLALVLDPPGLQRRPRWNRTWHLGVWGAIGFSLLALWAVGPRLIPMNDSETVRLIGHRMNERMAQPSVERALSWRVPESWATVVNPAGDVGFGSRHANRSFGVSERRYTDPRSPLSLATEWQQTVLGAWPEATFEQTDCSLAGGEALCLTADLPTPDQRRLFWRGRVRGLWSLEAVYEVASSSKRPLEALESRLWDGVVWDLPSTFDSARVHYEHRPNASRERDAWATQLAEIGRVEEALQVRESLVSDHPGEAAWWSGLLQLVEWYPTQTDARGVWQRALRHHPTGAMAAAVADAMDAAGNADAAHGLLELAWSQQPGDRSLKRARRSRDMSTVLDGAVPWRIRYDPRTGIPRPQGEFEDLSQASWTVAEAERIGAAYRLEQEAVVDAALEGLRDPEGDFLTPIRWLRNGSTTQNPEADARMVRDLHRATEDGVSPAWLPTRLVDGIRAHDERVGQLMNEETDPVLAP